MKGHPRLPVIEPWPLAARLASAPESTPWAVLAVPGHQVDSIAEDVRDQLASLLDTPVLLVTASSPDELISLSRNEQTMVVRGLHAFDMASWRHVDIHRSRLARSMPALLMLDEDDLPLVVQHAPNFWSWLSGAVWQGLPEGESPEQR